MLFFPYFSKKWHALPIFYNHKSKDSIKIQKNDNILHLLSSIACYDGINHDKT